MKDTPFCTAPQSLNLNTPEKARKASAAAGDHRSFVRQVQVIQGSQHKSVLTYLQLNKVDRCVMSFTSGLRILHPLHSVNNTA